MYSDVYSLDLMNYILHNFQKFKIQQNKVKDEVEEQLNTNFNFNNVKLVGDIPYYTFYNIQKTKERILEVDEDGLFAVWGFAGTGKSSLSLASTIYLNKDFDSKRIIFTFEELLEFFKIAAIEIEKEKTELNYKSYLRGIELTLDEGVYMLFSADANTKKGKLATKLFTIVRFLNMIIFINVTNFEKLNKTIRESRLVGLIRIPKKGVIEYYSKKKVQEIEVDSNLQVILPTPSFVEGVGYISKNNDIWSKYNARKAEFVSNSVKEIIEELNQAK